MSFTAFQVFLVQWCATWSLQELILAASQSSSVAMGAFYLHLLVSFMFPLQQCNTVAVQTEQDEVISTPELMIDEEFPDNGNLNAAGPSSHVPLDVAGSSHFNPYEAAGTLSANNRDPRFKAPRSGFTDNRKYSWTGSNTN